MPYINSLDFARESDKNDPLKKFRNQFYFPKVKGKRPLYFCGNSLGLEPRSAKKSVDTELDDWAILASEGHFKAHNPWYSYHEFFASPLAKIVGAKPHEVVAMNQLTVNLHLMLATFYHPRGRRNKIICESNAFSSDQYALQTHIEMRGYKSDDTIIEIAPEKGEQQIRNEKIIETINAHSEEAALVLIGGVNYLTGQLFNMPAIAEAAHKAGICCGFDLAHAAGNVELKLHEWEVDFAAWCSYKYLNSGPGAVGGVFIHEKHARNPQLPRLGGWWGYDKNTRFRMNKEFVPMSTAEGWQLSNAPIISMAVHKASLALFTQAGGMKPLCQKSKRLTGYLEFIISDINKKLGNKKIFLEIITPSDPRQRGCQLSIIAHGLGKKFHTSLSNAGVFCDWRNPDVVRFAPVPLYNSFEDIWRLGKIMEIALKLK